jgi:replication-associated recombination protein RarA
MHYLPEELGQPQYYVPGELGFEVEAAKHLLELRTGNADSPSVSD